MFLRCGDYLRFLMGLRKISTKICAQLHVFSLWRLTWVFDGPWKNFHKKVCPVTQFFAVQTILNFWWDLKSFDKKVWPVTQFFAVETLSSVSGDLESFDKKMWPVTHFFRSADYLKFWMGLRKVSTKMCAQLHVFFSLWRLTWVFDGTWKNFHKKSVPSHMFLRSGDYLKFLMGFRKISTKMCAQLHVFSLWRLTWVFDGTWKNFHKKVCPVTRFFAVETISSFWGDLESFDKKMWLVTHFFSLWRLTWIFEGTWKNFHKKVCPVICFFAVETISGFWWGLEKFPQKFVPSYTFFRCGD